MRKREIEKMKVHLMEGKKYCASCGFFKPIEGGEIRVIRNRYKRFVCETCKNRANPVGTGISGNQWKRSY